MLGRALVRYAYLYINIHVWYTHTRKTERFVVSTERSRWVTSSSEMNYFALAKFKFLSGPSCYSVLTCSSIYNELTCNKELKNNCHLLMNKLKTPSFLPLSSLATSLATSLHFWQLHRKQLNFSCFLSMFFVFHLHFLIFLPNYHTVEFVHAWSLFRTRWQLFVCFSNQCLNVFMWSDVTSPQLHTRCSQSFSKHYKHIYFVIIMFSFLNWVVMNNIVKF